MRRALLNQLGELSFPPRVNESYVEELLRNIDVERIRAKRFRIAVDYAFSSAALVMPALLRRLRVESFSAHSFMDPDEEAILAADLPAFTSQTRRLVEAMGADLGVVFDRAAERIILIDERAREIPPDTTLHLLLRPRRSTCERRRQVAAARERVAGGRADRRARGARGRPRPASARPG